MDIVITEVSMLNRFSCNISFGRTSRRLKEFKIQKKRNIREQECLILIELQLWKKWYRFVIIKLKNIGKQCITYTYTYFLSTNLKQYILNFLMIALCKYVSFSTIIHFTFDAIRKERNFLLYLALGNNEYEI